MQQTLGNLIKNKREKKRKQKLDITKKLLYLLNRLNFLKIISNLIFPLSLQYSLSSPLIFYLLK